MNNENTDLANLELSNIRDNINLLVYLNAKESDDVELINKISSSILTKILTVRTLAPDINVIRGEPLETLCLMNKDIVKHALSNLNQPELTDLADQYINSIQELVNFNIGEIQKVLGGHGCYLSPR